MIDNLTKTKIYGGVPAWAWRDPNNRRWFFYQSFGKWRYRREDHDVSSIGYSTLDNAKQALAVFFSDAHAASGAGE